VLVAQHLLKLGAHLVTALARLHVHNLARRSSLEAGSTREKKGRGGSDKRKKLRVAVWHEKQETQVARARVSRTGKLSDFPLLPLELWAPCKARWVWAGAVIFASATCSLQFAKASAATLLQKEKNDSADVQRGRVDISGFIYTVAS
jgi:hypothetical protein